MGQTPSTSSLGLEAFDKALRVHKDAVFEKRMQGTMCMPIESCMNGVPLHILDSHFHVAGPEEHRTTEIEHWKLESREGYMSS